MVLFKILLNKKRKFRNRQELTNSYFLCHNFWVIKTSAIFKNDGISPWNFMGKKVFPYLIDNSIDIHSLADIEMAKYLIKKNK